MARPVVAITGATAGVGRASARAFAERGFDVALLARGEAGLAAGARDVESLGRSALRVPTDVARFEDVDRAASAVADTLGPISVWVNETNLWDPVDDDGDHGAHGSFDEKAGGFTDPSFLETLPQTAKTFGIALGRTAKEKLRRYRRTARIKADGARRTRAAHARFAAEEATWTSPT